MRQAEALAGWLQAQGVQGRPRAAVHAELPAVRVAFYAVQRADAVVVPVNPMNRADEFGHYITDPGPAWPHQRRPGRHGGSRPTTAPAARRSACAHAGHALHRRDAMPDRGRPAEAPAPAHAALAARRPAAAAGARALGRRAGRRPAPGPRRGRSPTTWRCCPTPRAPPACPRAACTPPHADAQRGGRRPVGPRPAPRR
jgi:hypothetical protein